MLLLLSVSFMFDEDMVALFVVDEDSRTMLEFV
jgi:hypothetical protein